MRAIPFAPTPPGVLLHTLQAPGFTAAPPDIRKADLIPANAREAMHPAWSWGEYPPAEIGLYQLEDVVVADEGLVFRPGMDLVGASITQHRPDEIDAARAMIAGMEATPPLTGLHVLCVKRGATNYGHWLAEMLPMALLANRLLGDQVKFLVPQPGGALGETIHASLALAGIGPERIVELGVAPCPVRSLIMVHGLSLHGLYLSPLVATLLQDLAAPIAPSFPGCSLWVSRAGQGRCLWGEKDLGTVLHTSGWQVVNPGSLPFRDQVALFKGSAKIGGVMGAGLATLLFAAPGTRVELLAPAAMPDTFFYLISRLRGLRYRETRCCQTTQAFGASPWDGGLVQALPELMGILG
jgi:capsular polysaccharide biosynthesis protein